MAALWKTFSEDQKRVYMNSFTFFAIRVFPFWKLLNKEQKKMYAKAYVGWRSENWEGMPEGSPYTDGEWEVSIQYEWARNMEELEASDLYKAEFSRADHELFGTASWRKYAQQVMDREDNPNMTRMH